MSPVEVDNDAPARGRPRSADRTAAILDAAVEVMHEAGWEGFTVQAVANEAGAGLATIYRRWPTKEDLVADAMRHDIESTPLTGIDGTAREQLQEILTRFGDKMCGKGGSVISVFAAAKDHEAMREALDDVMRATVREGVRELIGEIIGADDPRAITLTDSFIGALIFRAGMLEIETPGDAFAVEMMALVDAVAG